jgi:DNA-binding NarL/FixJ family response regulator
LHGSDIDSQSNRELEIFSFIGRGLSASELASELNVSVKTIKTHQMRIKENSRCVAPPTCDKKLGNG